MWAFYRFLEVINYIIIAIASFGFLGQLFFLLLCWLPKKSYPKATKKARFAIIIPAHNESSVIGHTVDYMLQRLVYPKDLYDVFVCADNCTDDTAEVAKKAGAIVIERTDSNPNNRRASFPVRALTKLIITEYKGQYDAVVRFDADNLCNAEFLNYVHDA